MDYVNLQRHWGRIGKIFRSTAIQRIIVHELVATHEVPGYTDVDNIERGYNYLHSKSPLLIAEPETWRPVQFCRGEHQTRNKPGPRPAFYQYVRYAWCRYGSVVNLAVARQWQPEKDWRLVTSDSHATVIADDEIFDPQFLSLGVSVDDAYDLAVKQESSDDITDLVLSRGGLYHCQHFVQMLRYLREQGHADKAMQILGYVHPPKAVSA